MQPSQIIFLVISSSIFLYVWLFLDFNGRGATARAKFKSLMMKNETGIASAIQLKIGALTHRRRIVAVTDSRFMIMSRGLIGGFTMVDRQWKDLRDVRIEENLLPRVFGSDVTFDVSTEDGTDTFAIRKIPSGLALKIYTFAQRQEQAWEEKRRVRANEDVRAAAGGVFVGADRGGSPSADDAVASLQKIADLLEKGMITDAEYEEMKSKLLGRSI